MRLFNLSSSRVVSGRESFGNEPFIRPSVSKDKIVSVPPTVDPKIPTSIGCSVELCCDKCDGKHETDACPYYKKERGSHPDEQKNYWKKLGGVSTLPGAMLPNPRVVRQPGDGSCLFHSMSYGLKDGSNASTLRRDICTFIKKNPDLTISDTPIRDWVKWDSGASVSDYARRMSGSAWGGGIEMAALSQLRGVNVHVYERAKRGGYKRISAFDHADKPERRRVVKVVYQGQCHYDAIM